MFIRILIHLGIPMISVLHCLSIKCQHLQDKLNVLQLVISIFLFDQSETIKIFLRIWQMIKLIMDFWLISKPLQICRLKIYQPVSISIMSLVSLTLIWLIWKDWFWLFYWITDDFSTNNDATQVISIASCTCGDSLPSQLYFNYPHTMPPTATLIRFDFQLNYCSPTAHTIVITLGSTNTNGALAYELNNPSAAPGGTMITASSLEYSRGWPDFSISSLTNRLGFHITSFVCMTSISYTSVYLAPLSSFSTYSALQCVQVNPISIGLIWFVVSVFFNIKNNHFNFITNI